VSDYSWMPENFTTFHERKHWINRRRASGTRACSSWRIHWTTCLKLFATFLQNCLTLLSNTWLGINNTLSAVAFLRHSNIFKFSTTWNSGRLDQGWSCCRARIMNLVVRSLRYQQLTEHSYIVYTGLVISRQPCEWLCTRCRLFVCVSACNQVLQA